ncbi:MAG: hypothetical protein ACFCBW_11375 [Candidatus Competibacterales bacterium]
MSSAPLLPDSIDDLVADFEDISIDLDGLGVDFPLYLDSGDPLLPEGFSVEVTGPGVVTVVIPDLGLTSSASISPIWLL